MKKVLLVCCMLVSALLLLAIAGQDYGQKPAVTAETELPTILSAGDDVLEPVYTEADEVTRMEMKERYYLLVERLNLGLASAREITEIHDLALTYGLPVPAALEAGRDGEDPLDQGSTDTLGNCASATVISGCGYTDTGNLDGDNDCSVISASPYNEVFYTFTPAVSGSYTFTLTNTASTLLSPVAIRVVRGACCAGAIAVAFSSTTTTDVFCAAPVKTTYVSPLLTAGTQYWIHVGTSSSTAGDVSQYTLSVTCVPCPVDEPAVVHNTCATAVPALVCGDSLYGDSATSTNSDWYSIQVTSRDSVRIWLGGRAPGHCNSQLDGVDGRFDLVAGDCTTLIDTDDDGTSGVGTCSFDAAGIYCLDPGTYYLRVWNYGVQPYVLKIDCFECPPPQDCNVFFPCGTPAEVEPNSACADEANFISLNCTDGVTQEVYGTICPLADVDYYYIPTIPANRQIFIRLFQGDNCDAQPPIGSGLVMRGATGAGGICAAATGTQTYAYLIGSLCAGTPSAGGYIGVVRAGGPEQRYKITVECVALACPDVQLPNQHCAGPCVGWIYDYGPGPVTTAYSLTVPIEYHITDLNVRLNATHTFTGDVEIRLVTPWADTLLLAQNRGGGGDNWQITVFDDEGANGPIGGGVAPFNGSYIPEEALTAVDGFNAVGTWTIMFTDEVNADSGYVNCWCLEFEYDYILAAELNGFDAVGRDGEVEVTWSTASETDNDHFELVRNGTTVASIEATNSATGSSYSWVDRDVTNGTTYSYTLVAVDINGGRSELATESATPTSNEAIITEYALHQNYPNPFNPETQIVFDLVEAGNVTLTVYNLMGQEVATLVNGMKDAGRHVLTFDAMSLPSGLYLYKLEANGFTAQHKMLLLK